MRYEFRRWLDTIDVKNLVFNNDCSYWKYFNTKYRSPTSSIRRGSHTAFSAEHEVQSWSIKLLWCGPLAR